MELSSIGQAPRARGHLLKTPKFWTESDGFASGPLCHRLLAPHFDAVVALFGRLRSPPGITNLLSSTATIRPSAIVPG